MVSPAWQPTVPRPWVLSWWLKIFSHASATVVDPVSACRVVDIIRSTAAWFTPVPSCHHLPLTPFQGVALVSRIRTTRPG